MHDILWMMYKHYEGARTLSSKVFTMIGRVKENSVRSD